MLVSRETLVALGVGVVLVTGAFYVGASDESVPGEITVAKPPVRTYIPTADVNGNGISDWAEELLDDRETINSELDPVENYVPPSTLTERFSISFFQDYLVSKGFGDYGDSKEELAEQAVENLKQEARDNIYTIDDIIIGLDDSPQALHQYGNAIAAITIDYTSANKSDVNEIDILERAMSTKNPEKLSELDPIIDSYRNYFEQTLKTPVPPSLIQQHVDLVNVYNAILNDLLAMRLMFEDPLLGLLRFKRYNDDVGGLVYVYYNIDRVLRRSGIAYEQDEPGAMFEALGTLRSLLQQK